MTIPKRLRDRHGLKPGSDVDFELAEGGRAFLKARHRRRARSPGCVQWWAPDSTTSNTFTISSRPTPRMRSRGTRSALPRRRSSSSGKPLKDHLDHYEAIRYVRALARLGTPLTEADLRQLYLLMILILIRGGYPPVAVRPEDRPAYVGALQEAQAGRGPAASIVFSTSAWTRLWESI
ncbi:MAG TPA: AbrB/MazE/SpoVT family DNA-binding domain-containing protein [Stellaceae bacterium]|nr:AbrB/MazE/SpoVT family DNA-binding domain-containing protein [Stellaceae bacterium]